MFLRFSSKISKETPLPCSCARIQRWFHFQYKLTYSAINGQSEIRSVKTGGLERLVRSYLYGYKYKDQKFFVRKKFSIKIARYSQFPLVVVLKEYIVQTQAECNFKSRYLAIFCLR